jgi:hypothetical protein
MNVQTLSIGAKTFELSNGKIFARVEFAMVSEAMVCSEPRGFLIDLMFTDLRR